MNRGVSRRTIFESDRDMRKFRSYVAREVRRGRIELHSESLMSNHFHLLVRSVTGELSEVMRSIQNRYARWFNRSRRRDGPLFRGRFLSNRVDTLSYRREVVRYIHDNAVVAGIVSNPTDYKWSSAYLLTLQEEEEGQQQKKKKRPKWLATYWVDDELKRRGGEGTVAEQLEKAFPSRVDPEFRKHIERQLSARLPEELEGESLRYAGSPRVARWMVRKAKLADGTRPFHPVSPPKVVEEVVAVARGKLGPLIGRFRQHAKDAWIALRAGLLRMLAGCTHREIGMRAHRHESTTCRDVMDHRDLMQKAPDYEKLASSLTHQVLAIVRP
jgi:REP element-mobilizing transposase RayT